MNVEIISPPVPEDEVVLRMSKSEAARLMYMLEKHEASANTNITLHQMLYDAGIRPDITALTGGKYISILK